MSEVDISPLLWRLKLYPHEFTCEDGSLKQTIFLKHKFIKVVISFGCGHATTVYLDDNQSAHFDISFWQERRLNSLLKKLYKNKQEPAKRQLLTEIDKFFT